MIPKYRAWIKVENCFADYIESIRFYINEIDLCWGGVCESDCFNFDDVELMQSTGLQDKNGQEIFEGDVVTNGWKRQVVIFGTQEVEEDFGSIRIYRGFNLYLGGGYPNAIMSEFEVVGNIYENPDLLEADNDRD